MMLQGKKLPGNNLERKINGLAIYRGIDDRSDFRLGASCLMSRDSARSKDCLELVEKRILKSSNLMCALHLKECLCIEEC